MRELPASAIETSGSSCPTHIAVSQSHPFPTPLSFGRPIVRPFAVAATAAAGKRVLPHSGSTPLAEERTDADDDNDGKTGRSAEEKDDARVGQCNRGREPLRRRYQWGRHFLSRVISALETWTGLESAVE